MDTTYSAKISSQRQITLPFALLKLLGVDKYDRLVIRVDESKRITLEPQSSIVDQIAGGLTHLVPAEKRGGSFEEIREQAMREVAKELAHE